MLENDHYFLTYLQMLLNIFFFPPEIYYLCRKCYMFEDNAEDLSKRSAKGYYAGYIYCNDKK